MSKIYVVTRLGSNFDSPELVGAFSSREKADRYIDIELNNLKMYHGTNFSIVYNFKDHSSDYFVVDVLSLDPVAESEPEQI